MYYSSHRRCIHIVVVDIYNYICHSPVSFHIQGILDLKNANMVE